MPAGSFTADITAIRERARQKMEQGPVTRSRATSPKEVIAVLDDVLATEIVCWMRYTRHGISVTGIDRAQVCGELTEHAESERDHVTRTAERISQLSGNPGFDPATIAKHAHTPLERFADEDLEGMLRENLAAERVVITTYQEIIGWIGDADPATRTLMEDILADEEEHADGIAGLLGA